MKLFRCHALSLHVGEGQSYVGKTYVAMADTWQEARARVRAKEPAATLVTVPTEVADTLSTSVWSVTESEYAALRLACDWNENELRNV